MEIRDAYIGYGIGNKIFCRISISQKICSGNLGKPYEKNSGFLVGLHENLG